MAPLAARRVLRTLREPRCWLPWLQARRYTENIHTQCDHFDYFHNFKTVSSSVVLLTRYGPVGGQDCKEGSNPDNLNAKGAQASCDSDALRARTHVTAEV